MSPKALKKIRKRLGLSLAQAASKVHITARSWARYEAGDRTMPESTLHLFCLLNGLEYPQGQQAKMGAESA